MGNKKYKHLKFYMKAAETGELPTAYFIIGQGFFPCGLCKVASEGKLDRSLLDLFFPTISDQEWLLWEGHDTSYWGSESSDNQLGVFTPLRQTIVLFMAAMNDEL